MERMGMYERGVYERIAVRLSEMLGGSLDEEMKAWGITNYLDSRILMTLRRLGETDRLTLERARELGRLYAEFVDSLDADGTYFLPGCGTYALKYPADRIRDALAAMAEDTPEAVKAALAAVAKKYDQGRFDIDDVARVVSAAEDVQCPVCLEAVATGGDARRTTCGHDFCQPCIVEWLARHKTCPVCRLDLLGQGAGVACAGGPGAGAGAGAGVGYSSSS